MFLLQEHDKECRQKHLRRDSDDNQNAGKGSELQEQLRSHAQADQRNGKNCQRIHHKIDHQRYGTHHSGNPVLDHEIRACGLTARSRWGDGGKIDVSRRPDEAFSEPPAVAEAARDVQKGKSLKQDECQHTGNGGNQPCGICVADITREVRKREVLDLRGDRPEGQGGYQHEQDGKEPALFSCRRRGSCLGRRRFLPKKVPLGLRVAVLVHSKILNQKIGYASAQRSGARFAKEGSRAPNRRSVRSRRVSRYPSSTARMPPRMSGR